MKLTRDAVEANRERVIDTAATLFREKGIDGIGVADLMKAAGMTHGGFYRQFRSKDDLVVQAVSRAFTQMSAEITERLANSDQPFAALVRHYVSDHHRDDPGHGCSLASLATDAARHDDPALHEAFGGIVASYLDLLTGLVAGTTPEARRAAAIAVLAEMIGSVVLSRVVPDQFVAGEIIDTVATDLIERHAAKHSRP
ncbi:TetR/AcrR family transcriptional regulator [Sphingomonas sp. Leaf343]|uniref:TetR/AcrR family transcriptional regulator n=1 Tax=Sphingomonas sp. Leaf343 TaxID=1736345 RepID=UPI000701C95A|nr:TetR/AcrR family transcriptional regulator [Sphingomonas sp. Leaf343]